MEVGWEFWVLGYRITRSLLHFLGSEILYLLVSWLNSLVSKWILQNTVKFKVTFFAMSSMCIYEGRDITTNYNDLDSYIQWGLEFFSVLKVHCINLSVLLLSLNYLRKFQCVLSYSKMFLWILVLVNLFLYFQKKISLCSSNVYLS